MNKNINLDQELYNLVIGWNIICPKKDVLVKNILDENKILEDGIFYESNDESIYTPARKLYQNKGYWIKAKKEGSITLSYLEDIEIVKWGDIQNKQVIDIVLLFTEYEAESNTYDELIKAINIGNSFYVNIVNPFDYKTTKDNIYKKFSYYYKLGHRFFLSLNYSSILGALNESFNNINEIDTNIDLSQIVLLDIYSTAFNLLNSDGSISNRNKYINRMLPNDNLQIKILSDKINDDYGDYDEIVCVYVDDAYGRPFNSSFKNKFGSSIQFTSFTNSQIRQAIDYINLNGVDKKIYVIFIIFSADINLFLEDLKENLQIKLLYAETFAFSDSVLYDQNKLEKFYNYSGEFFQFIGTNPNIRYLKDNLDKSLKASTYTFLAIDCLKMMFDTDNLESEINNNHNKFEVISNNYYGLSGICKIDIDNFDRDVKNYTTCMISIKTLFDTDVLNDPFPYIITQILKEGGKVLKIGPDNTNIDYQFSNRNYFFTNFYNYNLEVSKINIPEGKTIDSVYGLGELSFTVMDYELENNYRKSNTNTSIKQSFTTTNKAIEIIPSPSDFNKNEINLIILNTLINLYVSYNLGTPEQVQQLLMGVTSLADPKVYQVLARLDSVIDGNQPINNKLLLNVLIQTIPANNGRYPNIISAIKFNTTDFTNEFRLASTVPDLIALLLAVNYQYFNSRGIQLYPIHDFIKEKNISEADFNEGLNLFISRDNYKMEIEVENISSKYDYDSEFGIIKINDKSAIPAVSFTYNETFSEPAGIIMNSLEISNLPTSYRRSDKVFYIKESGKIIIKRNNFYNNKYIGFTEKEVQISKLDDLIYGCSSKNAVNYNENVTNDDGSCIHPISVGKVTIEDDNDITLNKNGKINLFNITGGNGSYKYIVYQNDIIYHEDTTIKDINLYGLEKATYKFIISDDTENEIKAPSLEIIEEVNLITKEEELEPILNLNTISLNENFETSEITVNVEVNTIFSFIIVGYTEEKEVIMISLSEENFHTLDNGKIILTFSYTESSIPLEEEELEDNEGNRVKLELTDLYETDKSIYYATYLKKISTELLAYKRISDVIVLNLDDQMITFENKYYPNILPNIDESTFDFYEQTVIPLELEPDPMDMGEPMPKPNNLRLNFSNNNILSFYRLGNKKNYKKSKNGPKNIKIYDRRTKKENIFVRAIPKNEYDKLNEYSLENLNKIKNSQYPIEVKFKKAKNRPPLHKIKFNQRRKVYGDIVVQIIKRFQGNDGEQKIRHLGTWLVSSANNVLKWKKNIAPAKMLFDGFYEVLEPYKINNISFLPREVAEENKPVDLTEICPNGNCQNNTNNVSNSDNCNCCKCNE